MDRPEAKTTGWLGALHTLGDTLLGTVQDRLELLSLELQEEKLRLLQAMIWIAVAVFAGVMALTFGSLTVVYLFWESHRLAVLAALAVFYGVALFIAVRQIRRLVVKQPRPFAATIDELGEDRACLRRAP